MRASNFERENPVQKCWLYPRAVKAQMSRRLDAPNATSEVPRQGRAT
jgi:hypothetical protein